MSFADARTSGAWRRSSARTIASSSRLRRAGQRTRSLPKARKRTAPTAGRKTSVRIHAIVLAGSLRRRRTSGMSARATTSARTPIQTSALAAARGPSGARKTGARDGFRSSITRRVRLPAVVVRESSVSAPPLRSRFFCDARLFSSSRRGDRAARGARRGASWAGRAPSGRGRGASRARRRGSSAGRASSGSPRGGGALRRRGTSARAREAASLVPASSATHASTSKRSSTFDDTLFTFCPPGPDARDADPGQAEAARDQRSTR